MESMSVTVERAARSIFRLFPGKWEVAELRLNTGARSFWLYVIRDYSRGRFRKMDVANEKWDGFVQVF
ncbi:MAG: hypothetical protein JXD23_13545 [Spirochaetales bacterium]|nr:hypothetical protein [Spirochaetales bacterium]